MFLAHSRPAYKTLPLLNATSYPSSMLPRWVFLKSGAIVICIMLLFTARAASPQPAIPTIRYHFGDDPRWASPLFDDGAWPAAVNGTVPSAALHGDSFVWVRMRVRVPEGVQLPLGLHLTGVGAQPTSWRVFVNGRLAGGQGAFPPRANPVVSTDFPVMELPPGLAPSGSTVLIALREWQASSLFETRAPSHPAAAIDETRVLDLAQRARSAEIMAQNAPQYALSALLALLGIILLFYWRSSRAPEYLWAAIFLLVPLLDAILSSGFAVSHLPFRELIMAQAAMNVSGLIAEIELMWILFRLRARWLHIIWHAIWVGFIAAQIGGAWFVSSPAVERLCHVVIISLIPAFDAILFPVCIRELFRRGGNRAFAAAMCVMEVAIGLAALGYSVHISLGALPLDLVQLGVTMVTLAIAGLLIRRAVRAWRKADRLRVELEAAREVQQVLVPTATPSVPGFQIKGLYHPAGEVGGDFYQVVPTPAGGVLIVIGDVSGKGMPAAMTVSLLVGTFRTLAHYTQSPSEILSAMNQRMLARTHGGFTTCLVLRVDPDGTLIVANAGHLAPYIDGKEIALENGLPLGISPESVYAECTFRLESGARLTMLTDGVIEARDASGELFGFERTAASATEPAERIVQAAQAFGQEDDITVLTVGFEGAEVVLA